MQKTLIGVILANALVLLAAFAFFTLYAQFALDYSLENLRFALEVSQSEGAPKADHRALRSSLESLAIEELTKKEADFKTAALLDDAVYAIRQGFDPTGLARVQILLSEVLREKSRGRPLFLRFADSIYYFFKDVFELAQSIWGYYQRRSHPEPDISTSLEAVSALILNEAERTEMKWDLAEAERYYQEFLDRFPGRPERGFVGISLAHVLTKMRRFDEAESILKSIQLEFPGTREETVAAGLVERIAVIQERLARLPELENRIKARPDLLFSEEGGLELALSYLATYQMERAHSLLRKLSEAPDPRLRAKVLLYRGWIYQWQGELERSGELFQMLKSESSTA